MYGGGGGEIKSRLERERGRGGAMKSRLEWGEWVWVKSGWVVGGGAGGRD